MFCTDSLSETTQKGRTSSQGIGRYVSFRVVTVHYDSFETLPPGPEGWRRRLLSVVIFPIHSVLRR